MRLGYGVRVKEVRSREYVDVWRYETRGGRRVQVFEYLGALQDPDTAKKLESRMARFQAQAMEELRRRARRIGAVTGAG